MKKCRNLRGLMKAISNEETCCLEYTDKCYNPIDYMWIIYHKNGTNIIINNREYDKIKKYLIKV